MKSNDIEKVNGLLNEMDTLKDLTESTESFKDKGLRAEVCCEGKYLWFNKGDQQVADEQTIKIHSKTTGIFVDISEI